MIKYLVCGTEEAGIKDAEARGWIRLAFARFATPEKDDVRLVRRYSDLVPCGAPTRMIKGSDFAANPERKRFDQFVADGWGRWEDG